MKENVEETLIAPRDVVLVLVVDGQHVAHEVNVAHAGQIHEHHARVESEPAVVRVARESVVPAHVGLLVLGCQRSYLRLIEMCEVLPHVGQVREKQHVRVDVQQ